MSLSKEESRDGTRIIYGIETNKFDGSGTKFTVVYDQVFKNSSLIMRSNDELKDNLASLAVLTTRSNWYTTDQE